jgi:uncharacterized protein
MAHPDFEGAWRYALSRLEHELAPELVYHSLGHTRDDVVPAADRLAAQERVDGDGLRVLLTGAYFHDVGFVEQRQDHELAGVRIAQAVLPGFGFSPEQIQAVQGLLLATRLPQSPHNLFEAILTDADLDVLGREDYWTRNLDLRREWAAYGEHSTDRQWYESQLNFLESHHYFTDAARRLRGPVKQKNIERLRALLERLAHSDARER